MKTQVQKKPGLKEHEFIFVYESGENYEKKEGRVLIQDPDWDIVAESYKYLTDDNGKIDLVTPGKLIFDLCSLEYDDELKMDHRVMLSICSQLTVKFVLPINTELKKN